MTRKVINIFINISILSYISKNVTIVFVSNPSYDATFDLVSDISEYHLYLSVAETVHIDYIREYIIESMHHGFRGYRK